MGSPVFPPCILSDLNWNKIRGVKSARSSLNSESHPINCPGGVLVWHLSAVLVPVAHVPISVCSHRREKKMDVPWRKAEKKLYFKVFGESTRNSWTKFLNGLDNILVNHRFEALLLHVAQLEIWRTKGQREKIGQDHEIWSTFVNLFFVPQGYLSSWSFFFFRSVHTNKNFCSMWSISSLYWTNFSSAYRCK